MASPVMALLADIKTAISTVAPHAVDDTIKRVDDNGLSFEYDEHEYDILLQSDDTTKVVTIGIQ